MLKDAKVVTSKFLQLKDKLDKELITNESVFGPGQGNSYRDYSAPANIRTLQKCFGELCELLHELTVEEK